MVKIGEIKVSVQELGLKSCFFRTKIWIFRLWRGLAQKHVIDLRPCLMYDDDEDDDDNVEEKQFLAGYQMALAAEWANRVPALKMTMMTMMIRILLS